MNLEQIRKLAEEAGFRTHTPGELHAPWVEGTDITEEITNLVRLAMAAEREACAAICKKNGDEWTARNPRRQHHTGAGIGALACRDEILARGKTDPDGYGTATAG